MLVSRGKAGKKHSSDVAAFKVVWSTMLSCCG